MTLLNLRLHLKYLPCAKRLKGLVISQLLCHKAAWKQAESTPIELLTCPHSLHI